jgi:hypothetical protein
VTPVTPWRRTSWPGRGGSGPGTACRPLCQCPLSTMRWCRSDQDEAEHDICHARRAWIAPLRPSWKAVSGGRWPSPWAIWPNSVLGPVPTTTPRAVSARTTVPMSAHEGRAREEPPLGAGPVVFGAGVSGPAESAASPRRSPAPFQGPREPRPAHAGRPKDLPHLNS